MVEQVDSEGGVKHPIKDKGFCQMCVYSITLCMSKMRTGNLGIIQISKELTTCIITKLKIPRKGQEGQMEPKKRT